MKKSRLIRKQIFSCMVITCIVMFFGITTMAYQTSKEGVTMNYDLNLSGNTWKAQTFCYEDMGSMASLFIYKSKNGTLLESDCIKKHERTIVPGTSLSRTYASVTFTNKKANYAKSTHALLLLNTNTPYISALDLYKGK